MLNHAQFFPPHFALHPGAGLASTVETLSTEKYSLNYMFALPDANLALEDLMVSPSATIVHARPTGTRRHVASLSEPPASFVDGTYAGFGTG